MWLASITVELPAAEPVSLADARRQCKLEPDDLSLDPDLKTYIPAARAWAEKHTGLRLIEQLVEMRATRWDDLRSLPLGPVIDVASIGYHAGGAEISWTDGFRFTTGQWAGLSPERGSRWPASDARDPITVTATVGFGPDEQSIPPDIRVALLLLVAALVLNRGALPPGSTDGAELFLQPYCRQVA